MTSYLAAPYAPAYGAAKTGLMSLTRTLAVQFAGDGIRYRRMMPRARGRADIMRRRRSNITIVLQEEES
mgnify:CR=1 FL=1